MKKYAKRKATKRRRAQPEPRMPTKLSEQSLCGLGKIFTGFDTWYRANYDQNGKYVGTVQETEP